jgi:hypothetical protein
LHRFYRSSKVSKKNLRLERIQSGSKTSSHDKVGTNDSSNQEKMQDGQLNQVLTTGPNSGADLQESLPLSNTESVNLHEIVDETKHYDIVSDTTTEPYSSVHEAGQLYQIPNDVLLNLFSDKTEALIQTRHAQYSNNAPSVRPLRDHYQKEEEMVWCDLHQCLNELPTASFLCECTLLEEEYI